MMNTEAMTKREGIERIQRQDRLLVELLNACFDLLLLLKGQWRLVMDGYVIPTMTDHSIRTICSHRAFVAQNMRMVAVLSC